MGTTVSWSRRTTRGNAEPLIFVILIRSQTAKISRSTENYCKCVLVWRQLGDGVGGHHVGRQTPRRSADTTSVGRHH
ncbi:hypothetical protein LSAT2_012570, partial [Lamellibrachia satsuma]